MKRILIMPILLFLGLILTSGLLTAQDYIVTSKGDTLKGRVKLLDYSSEEKVQVSNNQNKKDVFSIFSIRAVILKGQVYHPVKDTKGYTFMKLIKEGYLSLYNYKIDGGVNYDGQYLVMKDGRKMQVPNLNFKKIMANFLGDNCVDIISQIRTGSLGRNELNEIIDQYNQCIADKTQGIKQANNKGEALTKKLNDWNEFEGKVFAQNDFDQKTDALEIIKEIKSKIQQTDKIPNYLIDALKNTLSKTSLQEDLETILRKP